MIGGGIPVAATDVLDASINHLEVPDVYTYPSGRATSLESRNRKP